MSFSRRTSSDLVVVMTAPGCEVHPELPCIWNLVYHATLAAGDNPKKFAHTLVPPRDWCLDKTNALANRFAGLDNSCKRQLIQVEGAQSQEAKK